MYFERYGERGVCNRFWDAYSLNEFGFKCFMSFHSLSCVWFLIQQELAVVLGHICKIVLITFLQLAPNSPTNGLPSLQLAVHLGSHCLLYDQIHSFPWLKHLSAINIYQSHQPLAHSQRSHHSSRSPACNSVIRKYRLPTKIFISRKSAFDPKFPP